jgi:hypothetical protein
MRGKMRVLSHFALPASACQTRGRNSQPASVCCGPRPPRGHSIACVGQISRAASPADQPVR